MTERDVAKIVNMISSFYRKAFGEFANSEEKELFIETWHKILSMYNFEDVEANLKEHVIYEKFPPTIAHLTKDLVRNRMKTEVSEGGARIDY